MTVRPLLLIPAAALGILICSGGGRGQTIQPPQPSVDRTHGWVLGSLKRVPTLEEARWLVKALERMATIHPGMTRADLLGVFATEGGISTRTERTFVYRDCPFLKVRVKFRPVPERHDADGRVVGREAPEDVVTSVSSPFVEPSIID